MAYEKLTTEYFNYLLNSIKIRSGYVELCRTLHAISFIPILEMDENRSDECKELRSDFADNHCDIEDAGNILNRELPAYRTYLELLVVLASYIHYNLLESEYDSKPEKWFLEMLENCGILPANDWEMDIQKKREIQGIINLINLRRFNWDGEGSFFPLRYPHSDQRYDEILVQANNYIAENYDIC